MRDRGGIRSLGGRGLHDHRLIASVEIGHGMTLDARRRLVYATLPGGGVAVFDLERTRLDAADEPEHVIDSGGMPFDLVFDSLRDQVFLLCMSGRTVERIGDGRRDTETTVVIGTGTSPRAPVMSPRGDALFFVCFDDDSVWRFDTASGSVVTSALPAGTGPRGLLALDRDGLGR